MKNGSVGLGVMLPNGAINWGCPCLGNMASGPCGVMFRRAFLCFHNSSGAAKGSECLGEFAALSECLSKYPKVFGDKEKSSSTSQTVSTALNSPT